MSILARKQQYEPILKTCAGIRHFLRPDQIWHDQESRILANGGIIGLRNVSREG